MKEFGIEPGLTRMAAKEEDRIAAKGSIDKLESFIMKYGIE